MDMRKILFYTIRLSDSQYIVRATYRDNNNDNLTQQYFKFRRKFEIENTTYSFRLSKLGTMPNTTSNQSIKRLQKTAKRGTKAAKLSILTELC